MCADARRGSQLASQLPLGRAAPGTQPRPVPRSFLLGPPVDANRAPVPASAPPRTLSRTLPHPVAPIAAAAVPYAPSSPRRPLPQFLLSAKRPPLITPAPPPPLLPPPAPVAVPASVPAPAPAPAGATFLSSYPTGSAVRHTKAGDAFIPPPPHRVVGEVANDSTLVVSVDGAPHALFPDVCDAAGLLVRPLVADDFPDVLPAAAGARDVHRYAMSLRAAKLLQACLEGASKQRGYTAFEFELPSERVLAFLARAAPPPAPPEGVRAKLPEPLRSAILPFQLEGVAFGVARRGAFLIADEMGTGKTLQAIAYLMYQGEFPALVLCPAAVRQQWVDELLRWSALAKADIFAFAVGRAEIPKQVRAVPPHPRVVVCSYSLAAQQVAKLHAARFRAVVLDESHKLKSPRAKASRLLLPLVTGIRRRVLLSGTPLESRAVELFMQLKMIDKGMLPPFAKFVARYAPGNHFQGSAYLRELRVLLERVAIRRYKKDVVAQLPPKRRLFVQLERLAVPIDATADPIEAYFKTSVAKAAPAAEYMRRLVAALPDGEQAVAFAHHTELITRVQEALGAKVSAAVLGSTSAQRRRNVLQKFAAGGLRSVVLSLRALSTGINLTSARLVVFCELGWSPAELLQAEDRVHRIGQARSVTVVYLVLPGSVDDRLQQQLAEKLSIAERCVGMNMYTPWARAPAAAAKPEAPGE